MTGESLAEFDFVQFEKLETYNNLAVFISFITVIANITDVAECHVMQAFAILAAIFVPHV